MARRNPRRKETKRNSSRSLSAPPRSLRSRKRQKIEQDEPSEGEESDWKNEQESSLFPRSPSMQTFRVRPRRLHLDTHLVLLPPDESEMTCKHEIQMQENYSLAPEDFNDLTAEGASFETDVTSNTQEYQVIVRNQFLIGADARPRDNIHVPGFRTVSDGKSVSIRFHQPKQYIQFDPNAIRMRPFNCAMYEMDENDDAFLRRLNTQQRGANRSLSEDTFELLIDDMENRSALKKFQRDVEHYKLAKSLRIQMDRLQILMDLVTRREKLWKENVQVTGIMREQKLSGLKEDFIAVRSNQDHYYRKRPSTCKVCYGGDSSNARTITCASCNVVVHEVCYGPIRMPARKKWQCDFCASGKRGAACCVLCPVSGGAMKQTKKGEWVHLTCALFMPGVILKPVRKGYTIDCSGISLERKDLVCGICKGTNGACLVCDDADCEKSFHVMCAMYRGYSIKVLPSSENSVPSKVVRGGIPEMKQFSFHCLQHAPAGFKLLDDLENFIGDTPIVTNTAAIGFDPNTDVRKDSDDDDEEIDIETLEDAKHKQQKFNEKTFDPLKRLFCSIPPLPATISPFKKGRKVYGTSDLYQNCSVCNEGDSSEGDMIIFCDGCNLAVHQSCYGIEKVPEGDWLCDRCLAGAPKVQCVLCPIKSGAFKQIKEGGWCHVVCALWMPGVSFADPNTLCGIQGVNQVSLDRQRLVCSFCHRRVGACIQCKFRNCVTPFHPSCLRRSTLGFMKLLESNSGQIMFLSFCKEHKEDGMKEFFRYHIARRGRHTPRLAVTSKLTDPTTTTTTTTTMITTPRMALRSRDRMLSPRGVGLSHFSPPPQRISVRPIEETESRKKASVVDLLAIETEDLATKHAITGTAVEKVFLHWKEKRNRTGKPLLSLYRSSVWDDLDIFQPFNFDEHPAFQLE